MTTDPDGPTVPSDRDERLALADALWPEGADAKVMPVSDQVRRRAATALRQTVAPTATDAINKAAWAFVGKAEHRDRDSLDVVLGFHAGAAYAIATRAATREPTETVNRIARGWLGRSPTNAEMRYALRALATHETAVLPGWMPLCQRPTERRRDRSADRADSALSGRGIPVRGRRLERLAAHVDYRIDDRRADKKDGRDQHHHEGFDLLGSGLRRDEYDEAEQKRKHGQDEKDDAHQGSPDRRGRSMSADSPIEWTDHTFNPWWGCSKVSPACDNCYAERDAGRYQPGRVLWGVDAERRAFGDNHWNEPLRWNRKAAASGKRLRVFCASMADVFDKNAPPGARERLWGLIAATPNLDWQLLTKRIGNAPRMVPTSWMEGAWPSNAWIGASVVTQEEVDRDLVKLSNLPAWIRFLSCEPMLELLDVSFWLPGVQWVIAGGESGPNARPMHPDWPRALRDQCAAAGVPFLLKQHGEWIECETEVSTDRPGTAVYVDDGYEVELADGRSYLTMVEHGTDFIRVGKKAAGRLLDGVQHDGFPKGRE